MSEELREELAGLFNRVYDRQLTIIDAIYLAEDLIQKRETEAYKKGYIEGGTDVMKRQLKEGREESQE